jgi:3-isopropylmalate/(R)-2-methylmalate dehydratase large subunit
MAMTAAEKIIARAAGLDHVRAGDYVSVSPDYTVCQEIAWIARKSIMARANNTRLANPDKVVMVVDHTTSAAMGTSYFQSHREMKDFAQSQGAHFYGAGSGLRHQVMVENGFARPGMLIFSDEPNVANVGVVGALNISVSSEVVATQLFERNWLQVPRSVRFTLTGRLQPGVTARDLVQIIIRDYSQGDQLSQSCVEYVGDGIEHLSLDERQTILACTYNAGADTALMPMDAIALRYVSERAGDKPYAVFESDPDASFAYERSYDLSTLGPVVTVPPDLHLVEPVEAVVGRKIDQAAIGSCANSRIEDLRAAASILKGRIIAPHVVLYITPGSREIYAQASREGILETLVEAGATILSPGCSTCWGYEGHLAAGEVQISTHQVNYVGRNGSRESLSYLAGPLVVAASAIAGVIADPRPYLTH